MATSDNPVSDIPGTRNLRTGRDEGYPIVESGPGTGNLEWCGRKGSSGTIYRDLNPFPGRSPPAWENRKAR